VVYRFADAEKQRAWETSAERVGEFQEVGEQLGP
jgi:antibiotic biosynthesis monooxygenase (ABM) superfamily enzyme